MPSQPEQARVVGDKAYLHKLLAAKHIYNIWTEKGTDVSGLANRLIDGSIDKLDCYMAITDCLADRSQYMDKPLGDSRMLGSDAAALVQCQDAMTSSTTVTSAHTQVEQQKHADGNDSCASTRQPGIPVRHKDDLSYQQFVQEFMRPNLPVMIQGLADDWQSSKDWVTNKGHVDIDFLDEHFGHAQVTVSDNSGSDAASAPRLDMTLDQFADWWRMHKAGHDDRLLYLKDWHFANEFPHYKAYKTPHYFQEDWLNEFYDMKQKKGCQGREKAAADTRGCIDQAAAHKGDTGTENLPALAAAIDCHRLPITDANQTSLGCSLGNKSDLDKADAVTTGMHDQDAVPPSSQSQCDIVSSDYRFVYLGCKGTWTGLHADVLRSYSWSTNVTGRKRWELLPPCYTHLLYDRFGRELAPSFDMSVSEGRSRFINLDKACQHVIECIQERGETIFVPSGWHHTVHNLEDTLSINHNWLNGYNIHWAWALLQQEHAEAAACIEDCREGCTLEEFEGLVQRNMAANCGMDYTFMAGFMHAILQRATEELRLHSDNADELLRHTFDREKATWLLEQLQQKQQSVKDS